MIDHDVGPQTSGGGYDDPRLECGPAILWDITFLCFSCGWFWHGGQLARAEASMLNRIKAMWARLWRRDRRSNEHEFYDQHEASSTTSTRPAGTGPRPRHGDLGIRLVETRCRARINPRLRVAPHTRDGSETRAEKGAPSCSSWSAWLVRRGLLPPESRSRQRFTPAGLQGRVRAPGRSPLGGLPALHDVDPFMGHLVVTELQQLHPVCQGPPLSLAGTSTTPGPHVP